MLDSAIYLPDDIRDEAEQVAARLGIRAADLYATAIADFLRRHTDVDVTAELDKIYGEVESKVDPVVLAMQLKSLPKESWQFHGEKFGGRSYLSQWVLRLDTDDRS